MYLKSGIVKFDQNPAAPETIHKGHLVFCPLTNIVRESEVCEPYSAIHSHHQIISYKVTNCTCLHVANPILHVNENTGLLIYRLV